MPELPEVETVRRGIEKAVVSSTIVEAKVTGRRSVRRQTAAEFERLVTGRRILGASRRGKYLLLPLDVGTLVVHLRMSGQLVLHESADAAVAPHTHARFLLDDGRELRFVDQRTFGELFVADAGEIRLDEALSSLGRDPLVDGVDANWLAEQLAGRRLSLKAFLLDQRRICGIGNIYADEICFAARLRPDRVVGSLRPRDLEALVDAIGDVISQAVEAGGSSLKDERYRDVFGDLGRFQGRLCVYGREGEECPRCRGKIERARVVGRSAHFCPTCQA
jgi:formamidopyrimidine-DNA glycosylase